MHEGGFHICFKCINVPRVGLDQVAMMAHIMASFRRRNVCILPDALQEYLLFYS